MILRSETNGALSASNYDGLTVYCAMRKFLNIIPPLDIQTTFVHSEDKAISSYNQSFACEGA